MKNPSVEISVRTSSESSFFKTNDAIQGEVLFAPRHATRLENIDISSQGILKLQTHATIGNY
jgi:hypothetical protein